MYGEKDLHIWHMKQWLCKHYWILHQIVSVLYITNVNLMLTVYSRYSCKQCDNKSVLEVHLHLRIWLLVWSQVWYIKTDVIGQLSSPVVGTVPSPVHKNWCYWSTWLLGINRSVMFRLVTSMATTMMWI